MNSNSSACSSLCSLRGSRCERLQLFKCTRLLLRGKMKLAKFELRVFDILNFDFAYFLNSNL